MSEGFENYERCVYATHKRQVFMECSITQMSNNRARLISRDKNSRSGGEKALRLL